MIGDLDPFPHLKYEYPIAGLRVLTNRPAQQLSATAGTDGNIVVVIVRRESDLAQFVNIAGITGDQEKWLPLVDSDGVLATVSEDGRIIRILDREQVISDFTLFLRQVIPFASALQNKLVLHASAVRTQEGILAFIGSSGTGKSTLARALCDRGYSPVADDLLPCRFSGQKVYVPMATDSSYGQLWPLISIYFLSRDRSLRKMELSRLSKMAHIQLQIRNGFGELPIAKMWQVQFAAYTNIAESVQAYQLILPDDLDYLEKALARLAQEYLPYRETLYMPLLKPLPEESAK